MRRGLALASVVSIVVLAPLLVGGAAAAAPPRPSTCYVSILQSEATISIVASPNESRQAVATASVTVSKPQLLDVAVAFNASTDNGWAADVSPGIQAFSGGITTTVVTITVTMPPGAPVGNRAHVLLTAEPDAGRFPCQGDSSSNLEVLSAPWVDRFEGRIDSDSLVVSDNARQVEFQVELVAVANTAIHVRIDYIVESGVVVDGPASLDLNPQQGGWDNTTFTVSIDGRYLRPGLHNFSMKVWGDVEGYPTLEGDLGMSILIPEHPELAAAAPPPALLPQPSSWIEVAIGISAVALVLVVSAPVAAILYKRRRRRLRRALARQRRSA